MQRSLSNAELIALLRNWDKDYVVRENERIKKTGEIFTPTELVNQILDNLESNNSRVFVDKDKTVIDPCCGNGQFLSEVLIRKLQNNISFEDALSTIYGIDIMLDNIDICRERLLCGQEQYRHIVERNIVCGDALTFNYDIWN
ncbi:N-6 DNA methylase [Polynucleobacter sp. JS-JIR-II-c23]|uniref:N-6 DNA methylase n=1 Tax=Polynucleobacter sp. JS-JIR-II-c23 TaxID=1758393 RepID=UPI002B2256BD|nr:N-6 DNA methylase [Polynucleobacter sp. JS-JIR-II-c23]MEA9604395.1 N-6 DNA methylase [Polynucleobacter sp. JS-JIR-II-c23]